MNRRSLILLSHFNAVWRFLKLDRDKVSMKEIDIIFKNRPTWTLNFTTLCLRLMTVAIKILTIIKSFQSKK